MEYKVDYVATTLNYLSYHDYESVQLFFGPHKTSCSNVISVQHTANVLPFREILAS